MLRPGPASRTEIHCHLLPGVDDGARDLDDSLEMAATAAADGTRTIVATPHVRGDFLTDVSILPELVREVRATLVRARIPIELEGGGELGHELAGRLGQDELDTIACGPAGRRWLLVEAPFDGIGADFATAAEELRARGFGVVVAHPERAAGVLAGGAEALRIELSRGSVLQVNLWSLTGGHGAEAEAAGLALLHRGWASVLASDSHPGWRRPTLSMGAAAARAAGLDAPAAESLVSLRPARLLRDGLSPGAGAPAPPYREPAARASWGPEPASRAAARIAGASESLSAPSPGSGWNR